MSVTIAEGPLSPVVAEPQQGGAGAVLRFEGVVRPTEQDQPIAALDYDAYRPMAETMLTELAEEMLEGHGLLNVHVEHAVGRVKVGEISFRLTIASEHRAEGLAAADEFITRMKQDVPLFKVPVAVAAVEG